MHANVAPLNVCAQAMLNVESLSIAKMTAGKDDEAQALRKRVDALPVGVTQAQFARRIGLGGGASMLSQHCSGNRPISLDAALAYAKGFGVSLRDISPRLADLVAEASALMGDGEVGGAAPISDAPAWPLRRFHPKAWEAIDVYDRGAMEDAMVAKLKELHAERGLGGAPTQQPKLNPPASKAA